ncbi:ATP-binding cassette domain-containing protein [Rubrobacter tropicus]|uniref:ATP-binding cassette domain-containing protein n=1 Tax=Rubrobacter tropicus TaxID=2653851 RepID=A0A6G8QFA7_9ACTN|nr:ATP-binding cassette domain-containing protein [Rubrobacter tropicus]
MDPVPGAPALLTRSVEAGYAGSSGLALRGVSLRVPAGTRVALVGPNGSGKSTLLKAVAGLLPVYSGEVRVYGNPIGACHHRVAYLPQRGEVDWRFPISVRKLVTSGRYVHLGWLRRPGQEDREIVADVLDKLGLSHLAGRQIGQLSGGQQQRALLARALVQEGDLLLLDEPLNAVDARTRETISEVLSGLRQAGKTTIVATHDLASLASEFDGAIYLREGREAEPEPGAFVGLPVGRGAAG